MKIDKFLVKYNFDFKYGKPLFDMAKEKKKFKKKLSKLLRCHNKSYLKYEVDNFEKE